jgi:hypothetical protein
MYQAREHLFSPEEKAAADAADARDAADAAAAAEAQQAAPQSEPTSQVALPEPKA